jgi:hypothetical protein
MTILDKTPRARTVQFWTLLLAAVCWGVLGTAFVDRTFGLIGSLVCLTLGTVFALLHRDPSEFRLGALEQRAKDAETRLTALEQVIAQNELRRGQTPGAMPRKAL